MAPTSAIGDAIVLGHNVLTKLDTRPMYFPQYILVSLEAHKSLKDAATVSRQEERWHPNGEHVGWVVTSRSLYKMGHKICKTVASMTL